jgi:hypothetical protein
VSVRLPYLGNLRETCVQRFVSSLRFSLFSLLSYALRRHLRLQIPLLTFFLHLSFLRFIMQLILWLATNSYLLLTKYNIGSPLSVAEFRNSLLSPSSKS